MRRTTPTLLALSLAVAAPSLGCAEDTEPVPVAVQEAPSGFDVAPIVAVNTGSNRPDVQLHRVFLGIGTVLLEPLDEERSVVSHRELMPLSFDLQSGYDEIAGAALRVPHAGRYEVSIAIEPMTDPSILGGSGGSGEGDENSVILEGIIIRSQSFDLDDVSPREEPEPLPWHPDNGDSHKMAIEGGSLTPVRLTKIPFEYHSARTGFIRLGEIELTPERNELFIHIELEGWLDEALAPILQDLIQEDARDPRILPNLMDSNIDLTRYLEETFGLEEFFGTSEASSF